MRELINDSFYELIEKYNRCIIDYCLMEDDKPYLGYESHKEAILFVMSKINERNNNYLQEINEELFIWQTDEEKLSGERIDSSTFLYVPEDIDNNYENLKNVSFKDMPYWYAFFETPHNTGYVKDDFNKINDVLFPGGANELEIYMWNTDWSDYFDDGHEWWGAACFSVYDRSLNRYVILMASTTD